MGCRSSRVLLVQPAAGSRSGWAERGEPESQPGTRNDQWKTGPAAQETLKINKDEVTLQKNIPSNARDGSAFSKGTLDSGVGLDEEGAGSHIPGTVAETVFSPRRVISLNNDISALNGEAVTRERQTSSDILEELMSEGILQSQSKVVKNGEAYNVLVDTPAKPLRKPPAKLEKLKIIKTNDKSLTKEDIEAKMKAAEERRKTKEEELKKRLRERPPTALPNMTQTEGDGSSLMLDDGQEAKVRSPMETLDSEALEKVISGPTQSPGAGDEDSERSAVESDNTYNNHTNDQSDIF